MPTVTLASKGQLTIPRVRQASIDRHARLVLVPSKDEPEDLFLHRPKVARVLSVADMDQAIASATSRENR